MNKITRHEIKYLLNEVQASLLEYKLALICKANNYSVKSLYFDDILNTAYYDKQEGVSVRNKFRLRVYNYDFNNIYLEQRKKVINVLYKDRIQVSNDFVRGILSGNLISEFEKSDILNKFYLDFENNNLLPKLIVDYDRCAFDFIPANLRITLDRNIKSSTNISDFYKNNISYNPLFYKGKVLLEIKYEDILPDFLSDMINLEKFERISFSKYYNCRKINY